MKKIIKKNKKEIVSSIIFLIIITLVANLGFWAALVEEVLAGGAQDLRIVSWGWRNDDGTEADGGGGATWMTVSQATEITGVSRLDVLRVRFNVYNAGAKDANGITMGVTYGTNADCTTGQTAIPVSGSCGSAPFCMYNTQLTDGGDTTDHSFITNGASSSFITGEQVDDAGNNSIESIDDSPRENTELEYGFQVTSNAVYDQVYYISVSAIDTYTGVCAKLTMESEPVTVTMTSGTDPSSATVAPESGIVDAGSFTVQASSGTDTVDTMSVTLASGTAYDHLSEVRVTSNDGVTLYYSAISNPSSDVLNFSGGTGVPVTASQVQFKIRVTPETHANMPVPAGADYTFLPYVSAWTSQGGYTKAGSDDNANTLTIDNSSPTTATGDSATAGNAQVTLNWTTSASTDYNSTVIFRWAASSPGAEKPTEGATYSVDQPVTTATVACVETTGTESTAESGVDGAGTGGCSAVALSNGQDYSYIAFSKDDYGNYDSDSPLTFSDNPLTPSAASGVFEVTASSSISFDAEGIETTFVSQTSTLTKSRALKIEDDRGTSAGWDVNLSAVDWQSGEDVPQLDYDGTGKDGNAGKMCAFPANAAISAEVGSITGVNVGATNDCFSAGVTSINVAYATATNGNGTYWLTDMKLEQFIPANPTAQEYTTTIIYTLISR